MKDKRWHNVVSSHDVVNQQQLLNVNSEISDYFIDLIKLLDS